MLSDLLPSSESDSEQDADSSQRDIEGDVKDVQDVARTREDKQLGEVYDTHTLPYLRAHRINERVSP